MNDLRALAEAAASYRQVVERRYHGRATWADVADADTALAEAERRALAATPEPTLDAERLIRTIRTFLAPLARDDYEPMFRAKRAGELLTKVDDYLARLSQPTQEQS